MRTLDSVDTGGALDGITDSSSGIAQTILLTVSFDDDASGSNKGRRGRPGGSREESVSLIEVTVEGLVSALECGSI